MLMLVFKALVLLSIDVTSAAGSVRLIIGLGFDLGTSTLKNTFKDGGSIAPKNTV